MKCRPNNHARAQPPRVYDMLTCGQNDHVSKMHRDGTKSAPSGTAMPHDLLHTARFRLAPRKCGEHGSTTSKRLLGFGHISLYFLIKKMRAGDKFNSPVGRHLRQPRLLYVQNCCVVFFQPPYMRLCACAGVIVPPEGSRRRIQNSSLCGGRNKLPNMF